MFNVSDVLFAMPLQQHRHLGNDLKPNGSSIVSGVPSVVQSSVQLPLKLCVSSYIPQKDADFKITINTNKSSFKLSDIFPGSSFEASRGRNHIHLLFRTPAYSFLFAEFVSSSDKTSSASQALGFQYYGGPTVTLLAAKSSCEESLFVFDSSCYRRRGGVEKIASH